MFNSVVQNIIRFLLLTLVQVMVLNNIHLHGLFNPYIYPLFILMLPIETPVWLVLMLGFGSGWVIDFYSHTGGLHASATTLVAFLRSPILRLLRPAGGYQPEDKPAISSLGAAYAAVLIVVHHLFLFIAESFSFLQFTFVMEKIFVSSLVSVSIMVILQYLFYRRKVRTLQ
jgi:rod shape-determining protein MreD